MRRLVPWLHAALLFAVWPPLERAFSVPKLALLCAGAAFALWLPRREGGERPFASAALAWIAIAAVSALAHPSAIDALLLDGAAGLLLYALVTRRWDVAAALRAIAWLGCLEAAVVLLQHGPRSARFGTLGNPDFAAAWLTVSLCLALGAKLRGAALLQAAALATTGSMGTVLALCAACAVALPRRPGALAAAAALCLAAAGGRPLEERLAGRIYLHRVAVAHLLDAPLTGLGPGAVRALWPQWEVAAFRESDRRFAAAQDHVHDDWLERALEQGWLCPILLAALAALAIARGRRRQPWAAAALASLCARAFVDFPLARPAELALFVTLLAALEVSPCATSPSPSSSLLPPRPPSAADTANA